MDNAAAGGFPGNIFLFKECNGGYEFRVTLEHLLAPLKRAFFGGTAACKAIAQRNIRDQQKEGLSLHSVLPGPNVFDMLFFFRAIPAKQNYFFRF